VDKIPKLVVKFDQQNMEELAELRREFAAFKTD